jgi:hypothetical protein
VRQGIYCRGVDTAVRVGFEKELELGTAWGGRRGGGGSWLHRQRTEILELYENVMFSKKFKHKMNSRVLGLNTKGTHVFWV